MQRPRPFQREAVDAVRRDLEQFPDDNLLVGLPTGCHAAGARVVMFDGTVKRVEDIVVGDVLLGPDSAPRNVLRLHRGKDDMGKVTPVKGDPFVVNKGHILSLKTTNENKKRPSSRDGTETISIALSTYVKKAKNFKHLHKLHRAERVTFAYRIPPALDPYDCWGKIHRNKYIPDIFKYGSVATRLAVLAGLIDTDGFVDERCTGVEYCTISDRLKDDFLFVARSLGFAAYAKRKETSWTWTNVAGSQRGNSEAWTISVSGELSDLPLVRRHRILKTRGQKKRHNVTGIKSVTSEGFGFYYGFELDGDHLYMTDDFTVHHNSGKSLVLALLCKELLQEFPMLRITMATHSQTLISQNAKTLLTNWPDAPVGIFSAGLGLKQSAAPITFCGIQSAAKHAALFGTQHVLIIDEGHAVAPGDETYYKKFIGGLKEKNKQLRVVGLTATMFRMKGGMLTNPGGLFSRVSYDITHRAAFVQLIAEGYLVPLLAKPTSFEYDTTKLKTTAGDFNKKDLEALTADNEKTYNAIFECLEQLHDRNHWVIFCTGIEHIENVIAILASLGQDAVACHSKMPPEENLININLFREGKVRIIVNAGMLTTGFDAPLIDAIILLRPTASSGLNVQILGRGTRPRFAPGYDLSTIAGRLEAIAASEKKNCRIMDYAANIKRNGPINAPRIPGEKRPGKGEMPIKICPACGAYNHAAARRCENIAENCDHIFPTTDKKTKTASDLSPVAYDDTSKKAPVEIPCEWLEVIKTEYDFHAKPGKPAMLKVSYQCHGGKKVYEFVCLDHQGTPLYFAKKFWKQRRPYLPPPVSTLDSLSHCSELMEPTWIFCDKNVKYPRVRAVHFAAGHPEPLPNPTIEATF